MGEGPLRVKSWASKEPLFCRQRRLGADIGFIVSLTRPFLKDVVRCTILRPSAQSSLPLSSTVMPMSDNDVVLKPKTKTKPKVERPKLYKIILVNDDYTPREFVIMVLKAVFRMSEETGYRVMMTAHKLGTCVVMVCARDIAETKAQEATDLAKSAGFPLMFTTEPEE